MSYQTEGNTRIPGFPGPWIGGITMILAPLLLLTGVLLRMPYNFFFPDQLRAYKENPTLMFSAYSFFLAGNILLWPAVLTLVQLIGNKKPGWAMWGGSFVMFGLFARTFHAGVDHLAFQLVNVEGVERATKVVADTYGAPHIISALSLLILAGWTILAIGAYLSRTLNIWCAVALALMSALMMGVLKGSSVVSVIATAGLCIGFVPAGIKLLKELPAPGYKAIAGWTVLILAFTAVLFFIGRAG